jgi:hypothetical protein
MDLLKSDMTEDNVTIDVLAERMDAFAERLLRLTQETVPLNFMVDNLAGFFSYIDGVKYGPGKLDVMGPPPFPGLDKSFPTVFTYLTKSGSSVLRFEFVYVPDSHYDLKLSRVTDKGVLRSRFIKTVASASSESGDVIRFEFVAGKPDSRERGTTLAYFGDEKSELGLQQVLADYVGHGGKAIRTSPYIALTLIDSFVNYVLNDRLLEELERKAREDGN